MQVLGTQIGQYNPLSAQAIPRRLPQDVSSSGVPSVNVGKWERLVSAAIGGYLVFRAIKNRRWSSLLFGGTGVGLLNRGVTGICPIYNKIGLTSTETTSSNQVH